LGRRGDRPGTDIIQGDDTRMKLNFFAAEFTKNTGQTTFEGGEGGSGDETIAKKVITKRMMTKHGGHFFEKKIR